jgi:hypothetical protein
MVSPLINERVMRICLSISVMVLACACSRVTENPESLGGRLNGRQRAEIVDNLGVPIREMVLTPSDCVGELRRGVLLAGVERYGEGVAWEVLEMWWEEGDRVTVVWCWRTSDDWQAFDGLKYARGTKF